MSERSAHNKNEQPEYAAAAGSSEMATAAEFSAIVPAPETSGNVIATGAQEIFDASTPAAQDDGPMIIANRLFIGGLTDNISRAELKTLFSQFGTVLSLKVIHDETGATKGYGFIDFAQKEDAEKALKESDNIRIGQRKLNIAQAQKKAKSSQVPNIIPHIIQNPFPVVYLPHTVVQNNYLATFAMAPMAAPMPTVSAVNESMYYPEFLPTLTVEDQNVNTPYYSVNTTVTHQGPSPYYPYYTPGPSYYIPPGNYGNVPIYNASIYPSVPFVHQGNYVPVNENMMYSAAHVSNQVALNNESLMYSAEAFSDYDQHDNVVVDNNADMHSDPPLCNYNQGEFVAANNNPLMFSTASYSDPSQMPSANRLWASCFASLQKAEGIIASVNTECSSSSASGPINQTTINTSNKDGTPSNAPCTNQSEIITSDKTETPSAAPSNENEIVTPVNDTTTSDDPPKNQNEAVTLLKKM